jgi:tetraacyldisaccharide-1-P 4'-kinase
MEHTGLQIQKALALRDHDTGIENIVSKLLAEGHNVITTEKDACRLSPDSAAHAKLFVAVQSVSVTPEAEARIMALLR